MYTGLHLKYRLFQSEFNESWIFLTDFRKLFKYRIWWRALHRVPTLYLATDGRREVTKLIDAFAILWTRLRSTSLGFYVALTRKRLWMRCSDWLLNTTLSRTRIWGGDGYMARLRSRSLPFPITSPYRKSLSVWWQWWCFQSDDSDGTVSLMTVMVLSVWWQWLYCQSDDSDCTMKVTKQLLSCVNIIQADLLQERYGYGCLVMKDRLVFLLACLILFCEIKLWDAVMTSSRICSSKCSAEFSTKACLCFIIHILLG